MKEFNEEVLAASNHSISEAQPYIKNDIQVETKEERDLSSLEFKPFIMQCNI